VTVDLWDFTLKTNPAEESGDLRTNTAVLRIRIPQSVAENHNYLFLDAPPVPCGATLQPDS
jgi:hypothetical protein